jgi:SWI/SNF-related matrix-associated actin-dependent regulator 1 of chromatin subfamily A
MSEQAIDIETMLPWSAPKRVTTRAGERNLRTAKATEDFWTLWRANKQTLKDAGLSCQPKRGTDEWEVCWWQALTPEDAAKAKEDRERQVSNLEASRAVNADVELPRPDGLEYLGYQKAGIVFVQDVWKSGRGGLIGDEMGLGKTIQAIGLINAEPAIRKVLIVCPNTLKANWRRELKKWLTRPMTIGIQDAGCGYVGDRYDITIINYDVVHKFPKLQETDWDLRVIDEGHYCKNPKARRTKFTLSTKSKRKVTLTGTPILNRPVELWPLINDLDPARWKKFFPFAKRYCSATHNGFGYDFSGSSNEAELQNILRSTVMVRRLKADVLTELPAKRRQVIELPADGHEDLIHDEAEAYEGHRANVEALMARVQMAKASENRADYEAAVDALREGQGAAFEEMAKLAHQTALAKVPQVVAYVQDALENGKVIIFAHHLDVIAQLREQFPKAAVVIGATKDRMAEVDRFQNDPACNVFIGNDAAAEGLTLTASSHVVFAEGDWVPGKLAQKEDRAHRIGQKDCVLVSHLVLEGSLDAVKIRAVVDKQDVIDKCLDRMGEAAAVAIPEVSEPVFVERGPVKCIKVTFEEVERDSKKLPKELVERAHRGMQMLAGICDGAHKRDDVGFSGVDVRIGHSFAGQLFLSPKQAAIAARLCIKYKRQLGAEFVEPFYAALDLKNPADRES